MKIHMNVLAVGKGLENLRESLEISQRFTNNKDITRMEPVLFEAKAEFSAGVAVVDGSLDVFVELVCSRCISPFCQKLQIPFHESFTLDAKHVKEDDDELHLVLEDKVDLLPYIEQTIALQLPFIPLCEEECQGLDPETGNNLNIYEMQHRGEKLDPRFAALAELFKDQ